MIKCEVCNREFKNYKSLSTHIRITHNISSKEYYDKYLKKEYEGICECRKETRFRKLSLGYHEFCSLKCSNKSNNTQEKKKQTYLKKYGCDNPMKNNEVKEKQIQAILKKQLSKVIKLLEYLDLKLLSEYKNNRELIKLKCLKCNTIFEVNYFNLQQKCGKCPICFPHYKSNCEIELLEFIRSLDFKIIENNRSVLDGKELDIYIPDKNIAIEFNGLYYHSEQFKIDKNYHLNKTEECLKRNIQLIHIFEDEWVYKQDIVKSRLKQILGVNNSQRIHARKCQIKEIDPKLKNEFLNRFHIQKEDRSNIKLGAFYEGELVSLMTFSKGNISKGFKSKEGIYELNRFCSNYNYHIPGIASKLLTYFKRNYSWKEIFSYADRRWSDGNLYKKIGFELDYITGPNYFYTNNNGLNRIHRFNLRKRPDEPTDIPEWILRQHEGYYRIWDCGHYKFKMKNNWELVTY